MTTQITRADLQDAFGNKPKLIRFFEQLFVTSSQAAADAKDAGAATGSIQDATVVTLGPNAAFNNERVLSVGAGLQLDTGTDAAVVIKLLYLIALNGGFQCTFNLSADTNLDLPTSGRLMTTTDIGALGNYLNDAAASVGGVPVGGLYRNGSAVMIRVV